MSEPKFTKGPWIATTCLDYWVEPQSAPDDGGFYGIAQCGDISWPGFREKQSEWEANAHLIASAPALYEALEELVEAAERVVGEHNAPHDCWSMGPSTGDPIKDYVICPGCVLLNEAIAARSALAQARGEQP